MSGRALRYPGTSRPARCYLTTSRIRVHAPVVEATWRLRSAGPGQVQFDRHLFGDLNRLRIAIGVAQATSAAVTVRDD